MASSAVTRPNRVGEEDQSTWAVAGRRLRQDRCATGALYTVLFLFGLAAFAPLIANGLPLYVQGHLTHLYENDVASFVDWHERYRQGVVRLRLGVGGDERNRLRSDMARYRAALPEILTRIAAAQADPGREDLLALRSSYEDLLGADPFRLNLAVFERLGAWIENRHCRLSLVTAYKAAAAPILELEGLLGEIEDERRSQEELALRGGVSPGEDRLHRLAARAEQIARETRDGVNSMNVFVSPRERAQLAQPAARACQALNELADHPIGEVRALVTQLEKALDHYVRMPVDPRQQLLPLETRWPVLAYLGASEAAGICLYLSVLSAFLARRRLFRLPLRYQFAWLLAPALLGGVLWWWVVPAPQPTAAGIYKQLAQRARTDPSSGTSIVFPPVPFGENETAHLDRAAPPILWELHQLDHWQGLSTGDSLPSLLRRMRLPGESQISPAQARARLTPLRSHWLGTDANGRDVLARLLLGGRVSLSIGFMAVSIYTLLGVLLGAIAGYWGGWPERVLSRFTEIVSCFPAFLLIITIMSVYDRPSILNIIVVIGLTRWTEIYRLVRAEFLRLGSADFVVAGQALGLSPPRLLFRHLFPNALGPVFIAVAFGFAGAILTESALSFLGFGVPQPQASWGSVLGDARGHEKLLWWITLFPGFLIFVTVAACNLLGEGLRGALDPRLRS